MSLHLLLSFCTARKSFAVGGSKEKRNINTIIISLAEKLAIFQQPFISFFLIA